MWKAWQVNETDAGKILAKKPHFWLREDSTVQFIETLNKKLNRPSEGLLKTSAGRYGGTYAHWQTALGYAKYLSPEFHIWCKVYPRRMCPAKGGANAWSISAGMHIAECSHIHILHRVHL
jgi:hypothetical protein